MQDLFCYAIFMILKWTYKEIRFLRSSREITADRHRSADRRLRNTDLKQASSSGSLVTFRTDLLYFVQLLLLFEICDSKLIVLYRAKTVVWRPSDGPAVQRPSNGDHPFEILSSISIDFFLGMNLAKFSKIFEKTLKCS